MWWDVLAANSWHIDSGVAAPGELLSPHFYLSPMEAGSSPCGTLFMGNISMVHK